MAKHTITAKANACIESIQDLTKAVLAAMDKAKPGDSLVLDLRPVQKADSSLGQLILAAGVEAEERGMAWQTLTDQSLTDLSTLLFCDMSCQACTVKQLRRRPAKGGATA